VADVTTCNEVDNVLGDVRGVIADALEILRDKDKFEGRENDGRVFHHVSKKLAKQLIAKPIDLIVALEDALRKFLVAANDGIQTVADHSLGEFAHTRKIDIRLHLRVAHDAHGGLRDVHGLVADAFEVAVDAGNRKEEAKIRGHGGLQGELALDALIDLDLHFVDGIFFVEHSFRNTFVRIKYGMNGLMDGTFGEAAHPKQALLQFFEIVFPVAFHVLTSISVGMDLSAKA
jgi:hypothetical protein